MTRGGYAWLWLWDRAEQALPLRHRGRDEFLLVRRRATGTSLRSGIGYALAIRPIFGKKTVTRALYLVKDRGDRRHDIR
jgi:hypothetical protein